MDYLPDDDKPDGRLPPAPSPPPPDPWAVLKALKALLVQPNRTSDVGVVR